MEFSIGQIAAILNGTVEGDQNALINNFAKIEEGKAGSISFLSNLKYEQFIYSTDSTAVIVSDSFKPKGEVKAALIKVSDPYLSVSQLMTMYQQMQKIKKEGISKNAHISDSASLESGVFVDAFAYVGDNAKVGKDTEIHPHAFLGNNVVVGSNCVIHPGVRIMDRCVIGNNSIIHPGAVIGADGFGFALNKNGEYQDIPQLGNVEIGNFVSIGANATIDRATMGSTRIANGVKIDNLVQIGHNVEIGENTVVASQTGVSGSTKIGKNCVIAGQVGFAGHLSIADGTRIGAKSGIAKSITTPNGDYSGHPLLPIKQYLRLMITLSKMK